MTTTDPYSDAYAVRAPEPKTNPHHGPSKRVAWPDGRIYRHTDGVLCGAGQNQTLVEEVGERVFGAYGKVESEPREILVCSTHKEEIVLAPRYTHTDDGSDCEANPENIRRGNWELECTLHEQPVSEVW